MEYQIRRDKSVSTKQCYFIRSKVPGTGFITDNMGNRDALLVARSLKALGHTVEDLRTA